LKTAFISNSFAAYKKGALARVGYFKNGLIFGEDTCSLARMLVEGGCVAYEGRAMVYHSHNYSFSEEFRRSFDIGVLHSREELLLKEFGTAEDVGAKYVVSTLAEAAKEGKLLAVADCLLRSGLKLLGYKAGRHYKRIPSRLRPLLSLNRSWWLRGTPE
jgi:rhamnosyltransferase